MDLLRRIYRFASSVMGLNSVFATVSAPFTWTLLSIIRIAGHGPVPIEHEWRLLMPPCSSSLPHREWQDVQLWWEALPETSTMCVDDDETRDRDEVEQEAAAAAEVAIRNSRELSSDECLAALSSPSSGKRAWPRAVISSDQDL